MQPPPLVYLAGPTVFLPDPEPAFATMKRLCAVQGLEGVSPLDNQLGLEGEAPGPALAERIVRADLALMRRVDAAVFCLDGFRRGPEMDPGTAFEIGFLHALGRPLAGWTRDPRPYPERVRAFFADVFGLPLVPAAPAGVGGLSGGLRDPDGVLVHSEGCVQNAMAHVGITLGGGTVEADATWEAAFGRAVAGLAGRLLAGRPLAGPGRYQGPGIRRACATEPDATG